MSLPSPRQLLEAGAQIGHKKQYSHPATRRFVYTIKDGLLVIDVEKTIEYLEAALQFLRHTLKEGGTILFVGTKPQAREAVKQTALALGQPYLIERWLGGTLTNFETVKKSLFQLENLEKKINDPAFEQLTKRERLHSKEKHAKLTNVFEGIAKLAKMPQALFIVDANFEDVAILEAASLGIPVVAIMDTNANPDRIDYPIPINDESKRAIELVLGVIRDELGAVKNTKRDEEKMPNAAPEAVPHEKPAAKPVKAAKKSRQQPKKISTKPVRAKKNKAGKSSGSR